MDARVVMTRNEALAKGLTRYFSGVPCKRGHIAERYITQQSSNCTECVRLGKQGRLGPLLVKKGESPPRGATRRVIGYTSANRFTPEPAYWPDDGGKLRVPIYDHMFDPPRLVRRVGWTNCLNPYSSHRIFSPDVARMRTCGHCQARNGRASVDLLEPGFA